MTDPLATSLISAAGALFVAVAGYVLTKMRRRGFAQSFWGAVAAAVIAGVLLWPLGTIKIADVVRRETPQPAEKRWQQVFDEMKKNSEMGRISHPLAKTHIYLDPRTNLEHYAYQFSLAGAPGRDSSTIPLQRRDAPCYALLPTSDLSWCAGHAFASHSPMSLTFWVTQNDYERQIVDLTDWDWSLIDAKGSRTGGAVRSARLDLLRGEYAKVVVDLGGLHNLREWPWDREFVLIVASRTSPHLVFRYRILLDIS